MLGEAEAPEGQPNNNPEHTGLASMMVVQQGETGVVAIRSRGLKEN